MRQVINCLPFDIFTQNFVYTQTLRRMIYSCKILSFDVRRQQFHFDVKVLKFRGLLKSQFTVYNGFNCI